MDSSIAILFFAKPTFFHGETIQEEIVSLDKLEQVRGIGTELL